MGAIEANRITEGPYGRAIFFPMGLILGVVRLFPEIPSSARSWPHGWLMGNFVVLPLILPYIPLLTLEVSLLSPLSSYYHICP